MGFDDRFKLLHQLVDWVERISTRIGKFFIFCGLIGLAVGMQGANGLVQSKGQANLRFFDENRDFFPSDVDSPYLCSTLGTLSPERPGLQSILTICTEGKNDGYFRVTNHRSASTLLSRDCILSLASRLKFDSQTMQDLISLEWIRNVEPMQEYNRA